MAQEDWKSLFESDELSRGSVYFQMGKVSSVSFTFSGGCNASVKGTKTYKVSASRNRADSSLVLTCSCQSPNPCKHEAALCFYLEKNRPVFFDTEAKRSAPLFTSPSEVKTNEFITPFKDRRKTYFSLERLLSEKGYIEKSIYSQAEKLHESKQMKLDEVRLDDVIANQDRLPSLRFTATFEDRFSERKTVKGSLSRKHLSQIECQGSSDECRKMNEGFKIWRSVKPKLCVHAVASLLSLSDYIADNDPGDETDTTAAYFIQATKKELGSFRYESLSPKTPSLESQEPVDIIPFVKPGSFSLEVYFRIGRVKYYVVKNCRELLEAYQGRRSLDFGKELCIDFATAKLTDRAKVCLKLIYDCSRPDDYLESGQVRNSVYIRSSLWETFFDGFSPFQPLDLVSGGAFLFKEEYPRECFGIDFENIFDEGEFSGVKVKPRAHLTAYSETNAFLIAERTLYRFPLKELGILRILATEEQKYQEGFTVGRKNYGWLLDQFIPEASLVCPVSDFDRSFCQAQIKTKPHFIFYLDYERGAVLLYATAAYPDGTYDVLAGQVHYDFSRNSEAEEAVVSKLCSMFDDFDGRSWKIESDSDTQFSFIREGYAMLFTMGEVRGSEAFSHVRLRRVPSIRGKVSLLESNLLDFTLESDELSVSEILEILESYRQKKAYHRLSDGSFVELDNPDLSELGLLANDLGLEKSAFDGDSFTLPLYDSLYLDRLEGIGLEKDMAFQKLIDDFGKKDSAVFEVPSELEGIIRPYQKEGFRWLSSLYHFGFGGILADEMGLGKTLQMQTLLLALKRSGVRQPSLVITPASLLYNWVNELGRYTEDLRILVVAGNQGERKALIASYVDYDVVVTSYDLLKRDLEYYQNCSFNVCVIDEAQYIKNASTDASKAVKSIRSRVRFALTGTPIENYLSELWSIFDFLMPGFLHSYSSFRENFEVPVTQNLDAPQAKRLKRLISPFVLRRLKTDVLDELPEKIDRIVYCEMEDSQLELYRAQSARIRSTISGQTELTLAENRISILAELMKLRQICCSPSLLYEDYDGPCAKTESCLQLISTAVEGGHKVLLFSQFTSMLSLLEKNLEDRGIAYYKLTGNTDKLERVRMVEAFNRNDVPVFLISLKAGGTGLNLTGADIVIHYDPWWNVAVQNQATDRAHRIGQDRVVTVYRLIAHNSIEEKIVELQEAKKNLAQEILSGQAVSVSSLSKEDLLDLLS